jgi:hypothetical protein
LNAELGGTSQTLGFIRQLVARRSKFSVRSSLFVIV